MENTATAILERTKHCNLCDHQILNFKTGTMCALTDAKPNFTGTCKTIEFRNKCEEVISGFEVEYALINRRKTETLLYFFAAVGGGIAVMVVGFFVGFIMNSFHIFDKISVSIMGAGLLLIPPGIYKITKFRNEKKVVEENIRRVREVLKLYSLAYVCEVQYGKEFDGKIPAWCEISWSKLN
ncbi:MAG: hypothetical protein GC181_14075 [Bacteroidetes bacterium]|nr:hypothetical protein [Bacteroidota bacterium]